MYGTKPDRDLRDSHACTFHGCVQILEIISCVVGIVSCFLNAPWLTKSGGGFAAFALIACLIFSAIFFFFHLFMDVTGYIRMQLAEWIGYICGVVLLGISLAVTIRASTLQYTQEASDGRLMLIDNASIIVTAVFTTFAILFYLVHAFQLSRLRLKDRKGGGTKPSKKKAKNEGKTASPSHNKS